MSKDCFCERSKGKQVAMMLAQKGPLKMILSRNQTGLYIESKDGGVLYYPEFCPLCGNRLRNSLRELMNG